MKDTKKIIIFSALISLNVVIWYGHFGDVFAKLVLIAILVFEFFDK
jgi:hypothetical protein